MFENLRTCLKSIYSLCVCFHTILYVDDWLNAVYLRLHQGLSKCQMLRLHQESMSNCLVYTQFNLIQFILNPPWPDPGSKRYHIDSYISIFHWFSLIITLILITFSHCLSLIITLILITFSYCLSLIITLILLTF